MVQRFSSPNDPLRTDSGSVESTIYERLSTINFRRRFFDGFRGRFGLPFGCPFQYALFWRVLRKGHVTLRGSPPHRVGCDTVDSARGSTVHTEENRVENTFEVDGKHEPAGRTWWTGGR